MDYQGTISRGVRAPIIKRGDDLVRITADCVVNASKEHGFPLQDKDVVAVTEAVLARAQGNYATTEQIAKDVHEKFGDETVGLVLPIFSRNRFSMILKGVAKGVKKLIIQLSYPSDEVGNSFVTPEQLIDQGVNPYADVFTAEEFKALVIEYEVEKTTDALIAANLGSLEAPSEEMVAEAKTALSANLYEAVVNGGAFNSGVVEDATYAEIFETVAAKLYANCTTAIANLATSQVYTESADDEVIAWVSNDETKTGATKVVELANETEYTKTVYIVSNEMHVDESITKDVAHILISADRDKATEAEKTAAKEKADSILAEFKAGEATLEAFEALAKDNNEDGNCVYKGVSAGQMTTEFNDWTFDESRQAGDTEVVETAYGYHVMYFIGEGKAKYYASALESYINEEYSEIIDELTEKHVTVSAKASK